jgi:hypothetical protein
MIEKFAIVQLTEEAFPCVAHIIFRTPTQSPLYSFNGEFNRNVSHQRHVLLIDDNETTIMVTIYCITFLNFLSSESTKSLFSCRGYRIMNLVRWAKTMPTTK